MLESSPRAMVTVQLMKPASRKLKITLGPATSMAAADPKQQPGTDRPAHRHHRHLAGAQLVLETVLGITGSGLIIPARIPESPIFPKTYSAA